MYLKKAWSPSILLGYHLSLVYLRIVVQTGPTSISHKRKNHSIRSGCGLNRIDVPVV